MGLGLTLIFWGFLTTVFMVKDLVERDCVPIVEGKRGCAMFVMSPPAHNTPVHLVGTQ